MRWLLVVLSVGLAFAQEDDVPLFKTGVSVVKVDLQIQDRTGSGIARLTPADFVVYDEGNPQQILDFAAEGEPLRLAMLLDVSGSMSRYLAELGARTTTLLRALRRGDEIALLNFATRCEVIQPLTAEIDKIGPRITGSIYKQTLGRATLINEAIVEAAKYLSAQPGKSRRAILIVTDNEGERSSVTNNQVVQALHAADIVLSAIVVGDDPAPYAQSRYRDPASAPPDVFRFASDSGGQAVTAIKAVDALQPLLKGLITRYSLQYSAPPAEDGSFRNIRVELAPHAAARYPGAIIKARSGYTVGATR